MDVSFTICEMGATLTAELHSGDAVTHRACHTLRIVKIAFLFYCLLIYPFDLCYFLGCYLGVCTLPSHACLQQDEKCRVSSDTLSNPRVRGVFH